MYLDMEMIFWADQFLLLYKQDLPRVYKRAYRIVILGVIIRVWAFVFWWQSLLFCVVTHEKETDIQTMLCPAAALHVYFILQHIIQQSLVLSQCIRSSYTTTSALSKNLIYAPLNSTLHSRATCAHVTGRMWSFLIARGQIHEALLY